jgi:signal transduction histidine kinase
MKSSDERPSRSLGVWVPLAFALFVVLGSVGLLLVFESRQRAEEQDAFAELARVNAEFMERARLSKNQQIASRLSEVLGAEVYFRDPARDFLLGPPLETLPAAALDMPLDGRVIQLADGRLAVGFADAAGMQMIFLREQRFQGLKSLGGEAWYAVGFFWALSIALGFVLSRWISLPLQELVKALPIVGTQKALPALPTHRRDEIGSLARVLEDTHQSLGDERERRRQAERLALLGRMAAGIAHEIRNPAAAIRLHAELLDAADVAAMSKSRELILREAARLENLVSQWMLLCRPEPPKTSEMDLVALLREVLEVMEPQAAHMHVQLDMVVPESGKVLLQADHHRLHQVFTNLVLNAIQAMPSGGRVELEVKQQPEKIEVKVRDEGGGFSAQALEGAGKPFFSEREGGLGLGLAVATEICQAHGGSLEFGNLESGGACIRVELRKAPAHHGSST